MQVSKNTAADDHRRCVLILCAAASCRSLSLGFERDLHARAPYSPGTTWPSMKENGIARLSTSLAPAKVASFGQRRATADERWALLVRCAPMMPRPAARSNRQICDGPRFCTTPHRRLCPRFRRVVRLPFDSGPVAQSRDRRDVPNASLRTARKTATFLAR
jgi:hypothetical protein